MVDWKKIPKIDAHIHLLPDEVIRANSGCGDIFVDYGRVSDYLNLMETYNIEHAFIMPFNDPNMLSMDFTVESSNSNLREMASGSLCKLSCFADVDIRKDIAQTILELEKTISRTEFTGIKLHPTNADYPIDGIYFDQIFQFANENGVLVEIHSYPREHLVDDICSPSRIKSVLKKYPKLKVSIAHLGGFQHEAFRGVDAYFNISSILPDIVKRYGIDGANRILRSIGVDRLVFATDYPDSRCLQPGSIYETYFEMLSKMDFTQEEAKCICKYNALKMIGDRKRCWC